MLPWHFKANDVIDIIGNKKPQNDLSKRQVVCGLVFDKSKFLKDGLEDLVEKSFLALRIITVVQKSRWGKRRPPLFLKVTLKMPPRLISSPFVANFEAYRIAVSEELTGLGSAEMPATRVDSAIHGPISRL